MARSKHRRGRSRSGITVIKAVARTSAAALRRVRAERRAYAAMPKPVPWEWAAPRLIPLLAGPYFDQPGEELVRSILPPGIAVTFGIDLGNGVLPFVDAPVAERWECTPDQICRSAVANLERRALQVEPGAVQSGTLSGHIIRLLERPMGWSSSLLLSPTNLVRLFGDHDQLFLAAGHGTLIGMGSDVPSHVARGLVFEYEAMELYPLLLDPFALVGGAVVWGGSDDYPDDGDDAELAMV
jgi:hypothetical protein